MKIKRKLKKDEHAYYLIMHDYDPFKDRMAELLSVIRLNSIYICPRRRYEDRLEYIVTLSDETVSYLLLAYGDLLRGDQS